MRAWPNGAAVSLAFATGHLCLRAHWVGRVAKSGLRV